MTTPALTAPRAGTAPPTPAVVGARLRAPAPREATGPWATAASRGMARRFWWLGLAGFAAVTLLVVTGLSDALDVGLATQLRAHVPWLDQVTVWLELPGLRSFIYPAVLAYVALLSRRERDLRPLAATLTMFLLINVVVGGVKTLTGRTTPRRGGPASLVDDLVGTVGAYPSGHAANIACVAGIAVLLACLYLTPAGRRWAVRGGLGAVGLVSACSWLRGTHWVTDLVAGVALGVALAGLAVLLVDRLPRIWPRTRARAGVRRWWLVAGFAVLALSSHWVVETYVLHLNDLTYFAEGTLAGLVVWWWVQRVLRAPYPADPPRTRTAGRRRSPTLVPALEWWNWQTRRT